MFHDPLPLTLCNIVNWLWFYFHWGLIFTLGVFSQMKVTNNALKHISHDSCLVSLTTLGIAGLLMLQSSRLKIEIPQREKKRKRLFSGSPDFFACVFWLCSHGFSVLRCLSCMFWYTWRTSHTLWFKKSSEVWKNCN